MLASTWLISCTAAPVEATVYDTRMRSASGRITSRCRRIVCVTAPDEPAGMLELDAGRISKVIPLGTATYKAKL